MIKLLWEITANIYLYISKNSALFSNLLKKCKKLSNLHKFMLQPQTWAARFGMKKSAYLCTDDWENKTPKTSKSRAPQTESKAAMRNF